VICPKFDGLDISDHVSNIHKRDFHLEVSAGELKERRFLYIIITKQNGQPRSFEMKQGPTPFCKYVFRFWSIIRSVSLHWEEPLLWCDHWLVASTFTEKRVSKRQLPTGYLIYAIRRSMETQIRLDLHYFIPNMPNFDDLDYSSPVRKGPWPCINKCFWWKKEQASEHFKYQK
jgi:hypothetical protein